MKKYAFVFALVAVFVFALPANAQFKFGVKGGLNMSAELPDTWRSVGSTDNYTGFFIGPTLNIKLPLGLGVDGSVLYSQKGNKIAGQNLKEQGLDVPLNLNFTLGLVKALKIYAAAGPDFFFNFNSADDLTLDGVAGQITYKNAEVALNLGAGILLFDHLQIGFNYNMPLTDSAKAEISDAGSLNDAWQVINGQSYKTKVWQASLTYFF